MIMYGVSEQLIKHTREHVNRIISGQPNMNMNMNLAHEHAYVRNFN